MSQDTRIPAGEPGLREEENDPKRRDASREQPQESRKESPSEEPLEGAPGYGEAPPDVRRHQLPDQGW